MDVANLDIRANSSSVKTASANLATFGSKAGLASKAMRVLAPVMAAALSAKIFTGLASQANQFSSALAEVSTLLNDTAKDMPLLTQNAKLLAAQFGGQPTDQVKAFYQAISAGAGGAEEATKLLTAANKLAIGGVTDVTTAVDGLTTIVNSFGLETSDATRVSDALFVAMKAGKTTVGELSGGVGKVAALASTAGLSFEEMLGSVSALTTGGIATNEAVTGLKAALTNILKPSSDAAKTAEALGLEFDMQSLQAKGLQGFLKDLVTQTGGNQSAMLKLFGSTEALNTVFALTGGSAEAFDDVMVNMGTSLGQTETAFNKVANTMSHQIEVLKGKFAATAIELGNFVVAATQPVVQHLNENFDAYKTYFINISKAFTDAASGIIKIWKPLFSFIADGMKEAFDFVIKLFAPILKFFVKLISSMIKTYATFLTGVTVGAEKAVRGFVNTFKNGFINVRQFIDTTKVTITRFYDLMKIKGESFFDSARTTERKLLEMDRDRKRSLDSITEAYEKERNQLVLVDEQASITAGYFEALSGTLDVAENFVNDLGSAVFTLSDDLVDVGAKTARWDAGALSASTSVGIFKNEVAATDSSVKLLDIGLTSMSTPTGTFRMVTKEMTAMSVANTETNAKLLAMEENSGKAGTALKDLTFEQQTFTTAVENTQTAFATLIKDTISSGKLDFKSFFSSVKEGWKTMVAEFAAKKIMDVIFGQGGLSGFLSSLSGGFGSIISAITNGAKSMFASITGSAVSSAAGSTAGSVAATSAGGVAGGATLGGMVAAGGQFVAGLTGSATGIAAGTVGPPTAAALAGSGVTAGLQAAGAKAVAFLTNPATIAIAAALLAAKLLDKSGTMSANAGMLTQNLAAVEADRKFAIAAFASGAQFTGFKRREDQSTAQSVVDSFSTLDSALTQASISAGVTPNINAGSFTGTDETGKKIGAFFGSASEDGKGKSQSLQSQLDAYASQFIQIVGSANGIDQATINAVIGGGTAAGILQRTQALAIPAPAMASAAATESISISSASASTAPIMLTASEFSDAISNSVPLNTTLSGPMQSTGPSQSSLVPVGQSSLVPIGAGDPLFDHLVNASAARLANFPSLSSFGTILGIRSDEEIKQIAKGIDLGAFTVGEVADQFSLLPSVVQQAFDQMKIDGSFASGINRIPFDGFRAELHEGERVQSVADVKRADLMASEMNSLRGNLNDLMLVVAKAVSKTARIESRWDINGLPPTRT